MDFQRLINMSKAEMIIFLGSREATGDFERWDDDDLRLFIAEAFYPELLDEVTRIIFAN